MERQLALHATKARVARLAHRLGAKHGEEEVHEAREAIEKLGIMNAVLEGCASVL